MCLRRCFYLFCCFCGHGSIEYSVAVQNLLIDNIRQLISQGVDTFYCGYYGNFDKLCSDAVNSLKIEFPNITLFAITPYPDDVLTKHNTFMALSSDEVYYPFDGMNVHPRFAIPKRNQWMVENSTYILAYVNPNSKGGAYTTLEFAKRKNKTIINLADL